MKYKNNEYKLSTGKTFYANNGIIGISPDLCISEGYDGGIDGEFTQSEKKEISEFMIDLWRRHEAFDERKSMGLI